MADSLRADPVSALLVRTQVARAQGLQRKFDDADATLESLALELLHQPEVEIRLGPSGLTRQHRAVGIGRRVELLETGIGVAEREPGQRHVRSKGDRLP